MEKSAIPSIINALTIALLLLFITVGYIEGIKLSYRSLTLGLVLGIIGSVFQSRYYTTDSQLSTVTTAAYILSIIISLHVFGNGEVLFFGIILTSSFLLWNIVGNIMS